MIFFIEKEKFEMKSSIYNVRTFTIAFCLPLSAAIVGTSFSRSAFTTLERYFGLATKELSYYMTVSQLISLAAPVFVNIMSKWHIPRILHISFWFKIIGFLVIISPYFIGPPYQPSIRTS